jgi:hypothetical protein
MGFNGINFQGSTYIKKGGGEGGEDIRTVEGEIEKALIASEIIQRKLYSIIHLNLACEDFLSRH